MKNKIWVPLVSLAVATVSMLSACSGSSGTAPSSTSATSSPGNEGKQDKASNDPINLTITMEDGGNKYAQQVKPDDIYYQTMSKFFSKWVGRPANVKYDMINANIYAQQMALKFSSGEIPDVMWINRIDDPTYAQAVDSGAILQLNDLIDKYGPNIKKNVPASAWKDPKISKDGKIYALPKMAAAQNIGVDLIRKDWLDKFGMKEPQTLDDYLQYFEAVKTRDPNGNGKNDEVGYVIRKGLGFSNSFFGYFGVYPGRWQYINGQFSPDLINPKMKDAINFYKKLYDNGYVNQNMFTATAPDWTQMINGDKAGMWFHQSLDLINGDDPENFADPQQVKVYPLAGPRDAQGKANLVPEATGVNAGYMISAKAKHPEDIIKFFDWAWSNDADKDKFFNFGIEGKNYTVSGSDIKWDPNAKENTDNAVKGFYQVMINPAQDVRLSPFAVKQSKYADLVNKAIEYTKENTFKDESMYMPLPPSMKTHPELDASDGSLFMDMFAKVVTGKEPLDSAFDKFVTTWKAQGGNQAIKEATDWYHSFYKK